MSLGDGCTHAVPAHGPPCRAPVLLRCARNPSMPTLKQSGLSASNQRLPNQLSAALLPGCSCRPCSARQHVPLPEYASNLRSIVGHLRDLGVPAIVLITPPPISEPDRIVHVKKVRGGRGGAWLHGGEAPAVPAPRLLVQPSCLQCKPRELAVWCANKWLAKHSLNARVQGVLRSMLPPGPCSTCPETHRCNAVPPIHSERPVLLLCCTRQAERKCPRPLCRPPCPADVRRDAGGARTHQRGGGAVRRRGRGAGPGAGRAVPQRVGRLPGTPTGPACTMRPLMC